MFHRLITLSILLSMATACSDSSSNSDLDAYEASRLLTQATFGSTKETANDLESSSASGWLDKQFSMDSAYDDLSEHHLNQETNLGQLRYIMSVYSPENDAYSLNASDEEFNNEGTYGVMRFYQMAATYHLFLTSEEQLRHRMAYALSQLLVVSTSETPLSRRVEAIAYYYDLLAKNAFGNYRDLLQDVATSPAMGVFLSLNGSQASVGSSSTKPDENFAREVMQLFTIGLVELNVDGSPKLNDDGDLIPTYEQIDIENIARSLSGWSVDNSSRFGRVGNTFGIYTKAMVDWDLEKDESSEYHDSGAKTYLGTTVSAGLSATEEMTLLLDTLMAHENVAPFVSKHLIQHFVTSNPSSEYIERVASVFNDNGDGEKGDLEATLRAILLDDEARNANAYEEGQAGKVREPFLQLTDMLRSFNIQGVSDSKNVLGEPIMPPLFLNYRIEGYLSQAPLRSETVFNFFSPNYTPSDEYFTENNLVLPEMEINQGQKLVTQINGFRTIIRSGNLDSDYDYSCETCGTYNDLLKMEFSPLVELFKSELGDDYENNNSTEVDDEGLTPKQRAIKLLIEELSVSLMNNNMPEDYVTLLTDYLETNTMGNDYQIKIAIWHSIQLLTSSNEFKILK